MDQPGQESSQSLLAELEALQDSLELRASVGAWADFGELLARREALMARLEPADTREIYLRVLRSNARILGFARADRDAVALGLDGLRQKQAVASFYAWHGGN